MNIKQSFRFAIKSIRSSKMRSFLTMLGIIIGVASVIVLISLMNGLASDMTSSFESMGTNTMTVNITGRGGNRSVSVEDIEELVLENPEYLDMYSPTVTAMITIKYGTNNMTSTATGVNEYYDAMQSLDLSSGRFIQYIDSERRQNVCVIGSYQVNELFSGVNPVGQTLKMNGSNFTVVGVLDETDGGTSGSGDDAIYIPYTTAQRQSMNGTISTYVLSAVDTDYIDETMAIVESKLYSIFEDEDAYSVMSLNSLIETINEMMSMISMVLVGIAGISLVVGGIGIMNIMLVSVTERTREIGIRKALGAKRLAIMSQFVIEAGTTSSIGGVIGIILGIIMAYVAGNIMDMSSAPSMFAILLAFSVSVTIGVVFGYFPASKAAKMMPVDALRHD